VTDTFRIIPLGGVGEVGNNMTIFELGETAIAVDCGLMFPQSDMLGIDLVIPDISYLMEAPDYLQGIFLTHGHEDHIGALPYVLRQIEAPLYATRLTRGLIEIKLREAGLLDTAQIHTVAPGDRVTVGPGYRDPLRLGGSYWGVQV
jgi:ribonuclease J